VVFFGFAGATMLVVEAFVGIVENIDPVCSTRFE